MERTEQQWKKRFEEDPAPGALSPDRKEALWASINRKRTNKRIPLWVSHLAAGVAGILLSWAGYRYIIDHRHEDNTVATHPASVEKTLVRDTVRVLVPVVNEVHNIADHQQSVAESYPHRKPLIPAVTGETPVSVQHSEIDTDLPKEQEVVLQPAERKQEEITLAVKPRVVHISDIAPHKEKPNIASQLMKMSNQKDNEYTSVSPFKAYQKN